MKKKCEKKIRKKNRYFNSRIPETWEVPMAMPGCIRMRVLRSINAIQEIPGNQKKKFRCTSIGYVILYLYTKFEMNPMNRFRVLVYTRMVKILSII